MAMTQWAASLTMITVLLLAGCSGGQLPAKPGAGGLRLAPCPASPNCVSSQASADEQRLEPLRYRGDALRAQQRLLTVLKAMPRVEIRCADADYMHAEFSSAWFGFVDDVEFYFDTPGVIQMRSAARTGHYDFGVNRQRLEAIRSHFATAAGADS